MKVYIKIIVGIIITLIIVITGFYVVLKAAFPPEKIRQSISEYGSQVLNRPIIIGDISLGLFPEIKVAVDDVQIENKEGFSAMPFFEIKQMALSVDFWSLVKFSPIISNIRLQEPKILYEINVEGKNNLEGLGASSESIPREEKSPTKSLNNITSSEDTPTMSSSESEKKKNLLPTLPIPLDLRSFNIVDASLYYKDASKEMEFILGSINQKIAVNADQQLENVNLNGELIISEIQINEKRSGLRKGNIKVSLQHNVHVNLPKQKISFELLQLGFQDVVIDVKGEINKFLENPFLLLEFNSNRINLLSLKKLPSDFAM